MYILPHVNSFSCIQDESQACFSFNNKLIKTLLFAFWRIKMYLYKDYILKLLKFSD